MKNLYRALFILFAHRLANLLHAVMKALMGKAHIRQQFENLGVGGFVRGQPLAEITGRGIRPSVKHNVVFDERQEVRMELVVVAAKLFEFRIEGVRITQIQLVQFARGIENLVVFIAPGSERGHQLLPRFRLLRGPRQWLIGFLRFGAILPRLVQICELPSEIVR